MLCAAQYFDGGDAWYTPLFKIVVDQSAWSVAWNSVYYVLLGEPRRRDADVLVTFQGKKTRRNYLCMRVRLALHFSLLGTCKEACMCWPHVCKAAVSGAALGVSPHAQRVLQA